MEILCETQTIPREWMTQGDNGWLHSLSSVRIPQQLVEIAPLSSWFTLGKLSHKGYFSQVTSLSGPWKVGHASCRLTSMQRADTLPIERPHEPHHFTQVKWGGSWGLHTSEAGIQWFRHPLLQSLCDKEKPTLLWPILCFNAASKTHASLPGNHIFLLCGSQPPENAWQICAENKDNIFSSRAVQPCLNAN